jgi:hypothetical protein
VAPGVIDSARSSATISTEGTATSTTPSATPERVGAGISSTANSAATIRPHHSGGAPMNDSPVNATMPIRLPIRSNRYAVSRGSLVKHFPTSSAGPAVITAAAANTIGSTTQVGGPVVNRLVK